MTVVIVTWQAVDLLRSCLASLAAQTLRHDVLVVDNASTDGTAELLATEYPDVEVLVQPRNVGFAGGIAAALPRVRTEFVALLNNDAVADPTWLEQSLAAAVRHPEAAAITSRMLLDPVDGRHTSPGTVNNAGVVLRSSGYGADRGLNEPDGPPYDVPAEVFGFSGGAAILRTEAARSVGGMPAEFFLYYEDTDLSWRMRLAGWSVWYEPKSVVHHRHAASSNPRSASFAYHNERNRLLMLLRCAPRGFAARQLLRFCVTTASLGVRRLLRQPMADAHVFRVGLRLRVLGGVLRRLPWALRTRRTIGRLSTVDRSAVTARWLEP